jgi:hypothetical protein
MPKLASKLYTVEEVKSVVYNSKTDRHVYSVLWAERKRGKPWITPVHLESLTTCPQLVLQFEKDVYAKFEKKNDNALKPTIGRKSGVHISLRSTVRANKSEYLPIGNEIVKKVLARSKEAVDGVWKDFYHVKFRRISGVKKMRLSVMEYYFPVDLIMFWNAHGFKFH